MSKIRCDACKKEFEEKDVEESHDIPCYLFEGNRKIRKQQADKYPRRYLCKFILYKQDGCHPEYEKALREFLIKQAKEFSDKYFKEGRNDTRKL